MHKELCEDVAYRSRKKKLLNRVRRIRGQLDGIERLLLKENDHDCLLVLQTIASCRGAINGLMSEVMGGHSREQVLDPNQKLTVAQTKAAEELVDIVKSYFH